MSYMQELDQWTDENVFGPLNDALESGTGFVEAVDRVQKAIRIKVLESYRNGAKRCPNCHGRESKPPQPPLRRRFRRERQ